MSQKSLQVMRDIPTVRGVLAGGILSAAIACSGGDTAGPAADASERVYWQLDLNHHAVTLSVTAPFDTVKLSAKALAADGTTISTDAPVVFTVIGNDTSVRVSTTGQVTGRVAKTGVRIVATQTIGRLTLTDTAICNITAITMVPKLTTFSIQPLPGDSAKIDDSGQFPKTLAARVLDAANVPIPNVVTYHRSSDSTFAKVDRSTGALTGIRPGLVTILAETFVYGITKTDTLRVTVGLPLFAYVNVLATTPTGSPAPVSAFFPGTVTVGAGAVVAWFNQSGQPVDVVFDSVSSVQAAYKTFVLAAPSGGGNIPAFASGSLFSGAVRTRWFPMAGTYQYHSALYGTTGTLIVK